ncbi:MAG: lipid-A-disaccharide synthase [Bacteroidota bacterium]
MKYYILAGEASGDLHGSNLVQALKKADKSAVVQAWGGDLMEDAGARVTKHYSELAFMGFVEVVKNLPTILNNFKACKKEIITFQPDALILIDYPGFNLRMAKWAKGQGIRVFYYISPQLWAWKAGRVKTIKKCVEKMYVILPFEQEFYQAYQLDVEYHGHPLVDVITDYSPDPEFYQKNNLNKAKPIIALLPGSRKQEIKRMLEGMLSIVSQFNNYQFVIAGAPSVEKSFYDLFLENFKNIKLVENQTYDLLSQAKGALVTSGTATLETALFKVPQVVCYTGNWFSFQLAKMLVNKDLKFISLVNLIVGKKIISELIQSDFNHKNLESELRNCLSEKGRKNILSAYDLLIGILNKGGVAEKIALQMVRRLKSN